MLTYAPFPPIFIGFLTKATKENINLIMPSKITFASGNANIVQDFLSVLDSVTLVLKEFDKTLVVISGHTDSSGSTALNQGLSEQRAQTVSNHLSQSGVLNDRLEVIGLGETSPVATNNTEEGKQLNRRVEISLFPISQS